MSSLFILGEKKRYVEITSVIRLKACVPSATTHMTSLWCRRYRTRSACVCVANATCCSRCSRFSAQRAPHHSITSVSNSVYNKCLRGICFVHADARIRAQSTFYFCEIGDSNYKQHIPRRIILFEPFSPFTA